MVWITRITSVKSKTTNPIWVSEFVKPGAYSITFPVNGADVIDLIKNTRHRKPKKGNETETLPLLNSRFPK